MIKPFKYGVSLYSFMGDFGTVLDLVCDVGDQQAVIASMAETVSALGRVDSCFVNAGVGGKAPSFVGMTDEESAPLLQFLFQHQVKPEFTCRIVWEPNAIAFWDNRCVQHNPVNDYHGHKRSMHRVTLKGDKPR